MKQGQSRIVGYEIEFDFLKAAEHYDILDDAGCGLAVHAHEFKTVAVQMQRMNIVAFIMITNDDFVSARQMAFIRSPRRRGRAAWAEW